MVTAYRITLSGDQILSAHKGRNQETGSWEELFLDIDFGMLLLLFRASLVAQMIKNLPSMQKTQVWKLGQKDLLEKRMATHSNILVWRIPWMEEAGGLQSRGHKQLNKTDGMYTQTQTKNNKNAYSWPFFFIKERIFFSLTKMVALLRCNE